MPWSDSSGLLAGDFGVNKEETGFTGMAGSCFPESNQVKSHRGERRPAGTLIRAQETPFRPVTSRTVT